MCNYVTKARSVFPSKVRIPILAKSGETFTPQFTPQSLPFPEEEKE